MSVDSVIQKLNEVILFPIIQLIAAAAVLYFVWGIALFIIKIDDPAGKENGKRHLLFGTIGMAVVFSAYGIVNLLSVQ